MFTAAELAQQAGVDPWKLRNDLAAGNPPEITSMARAFAQAGGDDEQATRLTQKASALTAQGYTVDGTPVHDEAKHVEETKRQLGGGGEKPRQIARVLGTISDDLQVRTTAATTAVKTLDGEIGAINTRWSAFLGNSGANLPGALHDEQRRRLLDEAVGRVRFHGTVVKGQFDAYEQGLSTHLKSLADLGYIPPDQLDEGPGGMALRDAKADATRFNGGLAKPGKDGLAEVVAGSRNVALLDAKARAGQPLTGVERTYLKDWYNGVGANNLAQLPAYARAATAGAVPPGQSNQAAVDLYRPVANGIMNLSKTVDGRSVSYADMPAAIQQLVGKDKDGNVDSKLGYVDPRTGLRWPNAKYVEPGTVQSVEASAVGGGVAGLDRYTGFTELMQASTATGGEEFSKELAGSAVRVKQDLNAMHAQARHSLDTWAASPGTVETLNAQIRDDAPSRMLEVVARNHDASSGVLLDPALRPAVMGLNWDNESGAASLLRAGTERDPRLGGGDPQQARAALAVITEIANDRDGYVKRMGEQMEAGARHVGLSYLDSFAREPTNGASRFVDAGTDPRGGPTGLVDALGRPVGPSFELNRVDRDQFLQFVSGTGESEAQDFHNKAIAISTRTMTEAFQNGQPHHVTEALRQAGRLDGAITQAAFDHVLDEKNVQGTQAAAAHRADSQRNLAAKAGVALAGAVGVTVAALATAASGGLAAPLTVGLIGAVANSSLTVGLVDDPPPTDQLPATRDALLDRDLEQYGGPRDYQILSAAVAAGTIDPRELPSGLVQPDPTHGYALRPPGDLADTRGKQAVGMALDQAVNSYEARHRTPTDSGDVDRLAYDQARATVGVGVWDHSNPRNSPWSDDRAHGLTYGANRLPADYFAEYPNDPRRLRQPEYDASKPNG